MDRALATWSIMVALWIIIAVQLAAVRRADSVPVRIALLVSSLVVYIPTFFLTEFNVAVDLVGFSRWDDWNADIPIFLAGASALMVLWAKLNPDRPSKLGAGILAASGVGLSLIYLGLLYSTGLWVTGSN